MPFCQKCGKKLKEGYTFCDVCGTRIEKETKTGVEFPKKITSSETKAKKKAWLSALLNLIFPGIGYVYNGKRLFFGVGLIISCVVMLGIYIINPALYTWSAYLDGIILNILFAYDGYKEAKEINGS